MKIIFIYRSIALCGGLERVQTEKANWLSSRGHEVLFLTYDQGNHPLSFELSENVTHEDLDCRYFTIYQKPVWLRPISKLMMKRKFRQRLMEKVQYFHPGMIVYPVNLEEFESVITSLDCHVPVVCECHGPFAEIMGTAHSWKCKARAANIKRCRLVITLTERDAQCWKPYNQQVITLSNPLSDYPKTLLNDSHKETGRIICASRLTCVKRIDRLIEAFALIADHHPAWHIDIYGEGVERERLLRLIAEKNLTGRVVLCQPTNDIYKEYMRSEFLVLSPDTEGFGLVIIEAMACGIPVVSTDCPYGPGEIVKDGETGLLSKLDVKDFAQKMEWMITHEKERKEMGCKARKAAGRYEMNHVMKEWEATYFSVLDSK
ncbi:MAG: glycosyltransferase family 4 protein [Prevotella sp.]|nr:glycosyltransferase family 4 protein [Prevotella sp.]